jgi:putative ABC transport system permease protein
VVGDVKQLSLGGARSDAVYATTAQWLWADNVQWLVVRARGDPAALAPAVRAAVWAVDKDQPVVRLGTMDALVAASEAQRRFAMLIFEAFALVALALAATGIYGVLSCSVNERLREMGVRSALGATPGAIRRLVLRQGMALTLLGSALGLAGAAAASRGLSTLLYGISHLDAGVYAGVVGLLLAVAALACWLPAWRAARVDPASTLRSD